MPWLFVHRYWSQGERFLSYPTLRNQTPKFCNLLSSTEINNTSAAGSALSLRYVARSSGRSNKCTNFLINILNNVHPEFGPRKPNYLDERLSWRLRSKDLLAVKQ